MKISGILETCLYAEDLEEAKVFYSALPGIELQSEEKGRHVFFKCGEGMLLIFNPAHTSKEQSQVDGADIPLHGTIGAGHVAFSIRKEELNAWKQFFEKNDIPVESEVRWPNSSVSLYFRDPAGNSLELVSPDIWE